MLTAALVCLGLIPVVVVMAAVVLWLAHTDRIKFESTPFLILWGGQVICAALMTTAIVLGVIALVQRVLK